LEIGNQALGLFQTLVAGIGVSIIPFVDVDYDLIHQKTKERTSKIHNKFKHVFDRTDAALQDNEFKMLAFLLNPGASMAAVAAKSAISLAKGLKSKGKEALKASVSAARGLKTQIAGMEKEFFSEQVKKSTKNINVLTEDKKISKINKSNLAQEMKSDAISIIKQRLNDVFNIAKKIDNATSIEELQSIMHFDKKHLQTFKKIKSTEDKAEVEVQLLDDMTEQIKNALIGKLETEKSSFENVPFDVSDAIKLYDQAINTLKGI
jgi:hypothetical protein